MVNCPSRYRSYLENVKTRAKLLQTLLFGAMCLAASTGAEESVNASGTDWFTKHTAESFRKLKAAQEKIEPEQINRDLLDAAVFHETNRQRKQHGLPVLAYDARAREAARLQSRAMAKHKFIGHENPFNPELKTAMDRARRAGLQPKMLAENVASSFARKYQGGEKVFVRVENGKEIYSAKPGGPPIPMRTYVEFAEALLDDWMNSPGHRENILRKEPKYLGCASEPGINDGAMEKVYSAQVFFTPLRK